MLTKSNCKRSVMAVVVLSGLTLGIVSAQTMARAQVGNLIVKVENGVDEFSDYLKRRGDDAGDSGTATQARARRGKQATESQKAAASDKKDDLSSSLDDLNGSTNRLRRKFDSTDKWMETKSQVERVVEDGRKINQAMTRGNYGTDAARLWGVLRNGINDLARAYGVSPLGV